MVNFNAGLKALYLYACIFMIVALATFIFIKENKEARLKNKTLSKRKGFELLDNAQCVQDLAAIGEEFSLPANASYFEIECQTGTYIRSLAKLLATRLGTVATAGVIIRTRVGDFKIADARILKEISLDDLKPMEEFL